MIRLLIAVALSASISLFGTRFLIGWMTRHRIGQPIRDDGPDGMALRFEHVSPGLARRLEELVTSLPSIEPLRDGETAAMGAVVSRIVSEGPPQAE